MKKTKKALKEDELSTLSSSCKLDCSPDVSSHHSKGKRRPATERFSQTICEKLRHYVYRLVDPRSEETFYVGMGTNNRVFDHVHAALQPTEDEDEFDLKTELIRDIQNDGFSVTAIIHRHGLDRKMALEVEAALIDAYPELANIRAGHGSALRGCKSIEQVKALYGAREADFANIKAVIIKIRQTFVDERGSVYEAVRAAWKIDPNRVKGRPVVASVGGVIKGVYTDVKWRKSKKYPERYGFTARESREKAHKALIGCRLPTQYCRPGQANPIRYT